MAYASSIERNLRVGTTLANASVLPELSNPSNVETPVSTLAAARLQLSAFRWHRRTSEAQLFAQDSSPSKSRIVGVFSIARRKRNHVLNSMRRASTQEIPPRSKTTTPQPPPCSSRSVVFSACSRRFHGFTLLPPVRTGGGGLDSRSDGKKRCGRRPRRGGSLSRSTCSAQRATTWSCADST